MNLIKYAAIGAGLLILLLVIAALAPPLASPASKPVPRPPIVQEMYGCNRPPAAWTEREMRCVVRARFGPSGQYDNALRIVGCETGYTWNRFLVSHTDDHGLFQINRRWNSDPWERPFRWGRSIYDPVVNTQWAHYYWRTRGWGDWVCADIVGVQ